MNEFIAEAGKSILVEDTLHYDRLTICPGACFTAAGEKTLAMTAGGIETAMLPGEYSDVVISARDKISDIIDGYNGYDYSCALYVDKNGINESASHISAISGQFDSGAMKDAAVHSENEFFGGVIINGAEYEIDGYSAQLNGCGGSDFAGVGMGLLCVQSTVKARGLNIRNSGAIRGAVFVADNSQVHISDSEIYTSGGPESVADELAERIAKPGAAGPKPMTKVPWALGIRGTNRATNLVGTGTVTYENCKIRANEWGALSTDGPDDPSFPGEYRLHLNTKDCLVEITGPSGYGAYSIAATQDIFDHTVFNVPDYGVIIANEHASVILKNGSEIHSGRFGLMYHQNQGGLTEIKNSKIEAGMTPILIKSCYPEIHIEDSSITAGNGVLVQLMDSDDPRRGFGWYDIDFTDEGKAVKDETHDPCGENIRKYKMAGFDYERGTNAALSFSGMELRGDFYNSMTNAVSIGMEKIDPENDHAPGGRPKPSVTCCINLELSFDKCSIQGKISSSKAKHRVTIINPDNREELGVVENTPAKAVNNGVLAELKNTSWIVTGECYLTRLSLDDASSIVKPDGSPAELVVNGETAELKAGVYAGDIIIK